MGTNKGVVLAIITLVLGMLMCGCGVNRKSPEGVVKSLLAAYEEGKEKNALSCYGMEDNADAVTKEEVAANINYFKAHDAKGVNILECDVIKEIGSSAYVYITYQFELDKDKKYPAISTYLVGKEDKKYYVMPAKEINEDLGKQVQAAYKDFMDSDAYKEYTKLYDAFVTKHPGYEDKIAGKLKK